jgi:YesN/AraC family two-component response regulator
MEPARRTIAMKICVVDDEHEVRISIIQKLETLFPAAQIFDGEFGYSALDRIKLVQPDLILMDIRMPELDGLEILRAIKPMYPAIHVVILSGYEDFEYARQAFQYGAAGYLLKPADRDELRDIVDKVKLDMQETLLKETDVILAKLSGLYLYIDHVQCFNASLWFDERQRKDIYVGEAETLRKAWAKAPERILMQFSVNRDYECIVARGSEGRGGFGFHAKSDFLAALVSGIEAWESSRFFEDSQMDRHGQVKNRNNAAAQLAAQLRQQILSMAKEGNYDQLEASLDAWLRDLNDLAYTPLKKECVHLMALLDEGLTKSEIFVLDEEKIHYWWQWVSHYKTWNELKGKLRGFILNGVKALILLDNQPGLSWFEQALQLVDTSRDPNLSLESVAESVGVHPVTLSRIFKQQTGVNFVKYMMSRKLREAQHLILHSDKKINEIMEEIGYVDHRHFRSVFKKEFGLTPSEYRKRKGNAADNEPTEPLG